MCSDMIGVCKYCLVLLLVVFRHDGVRAADVSETCEPRMYRNKNAPGAICVACPLDMAICDRETPEDAQRCRTSCEIKPEVEVDVNVTKVFSTSSSSQSSSPKTKCDNNSSKDDVILYSIWALIAVFVLVIIPLLVAILVSLRRHPRRDCRGDNSRSVDTGNNVASSHYVTVEMDAPETSRTVDDDTHENSGSERTGSPSTPLLPHHDANEEVDGERTSLRSWISHIAEDETDL